MDYEKNQYPSINAAENNNYSGKLINYPGEIAKNKSAAGELINYSEGKSEYSGESGVKNNYLVEQPKNKNGNNYFYSDRANPRAWNKAPKIIIFSGELTATEKTFYLMLQDYQWRRINPPQAELAQALNCTERNIRKLACKLKEAGLLTTVRTGRANRYVLTDLETGEIPPLGSRPSSRAATTTNAGTDGAGQRLGRQEQTEQVSDQVENQLSSGPKKFLPEIAEAEFQSERNCDSSRKLTINKNNKNHVCSTSLDDIPQRDMTESAEPAIKPKMGSRGQPLVEGAGESALGVQGSKSPALFPLAKSVAISAKTEPDEKQRDFVKIFENLQAFGFSEAPAQQVLELAYKRHGDQAGDYLEKWTERINNYSWVANPQGYMRRAVVENWSLPRQKRQPGQPPDQSRPTRAARQPATAKAINPYHVPADLSKFAPGGKYAHVLNQHQQ